MILNQFQTIGRDLFTANLATSTGGNLSIRMGDRMLITRRGCRLANLEEADLIETGIITNDRFTPFASSELLVHRAIYKATSAQAIVHAHPPHSLALSLTEQEIVPRCVEGMALVGKVAVVGWDLEPKSKQTTEAVVGALKENHIVMVYGHGSFAIGQLLEEAYNYTTALEASCQVLCLLKSIGAAR